MHRYKRTQTRIIFFSAPKNLMLTAAILLAAVPALAQAPAHIAKVKAHRPAKKVAPAPEVVQAPPPPPMPSWPVNARPNPPSVVWDASGLRINASNSSLQQILSEVSTDTGSKVVGNVPDQRVFGSYGPGQASEVLLQLLQGSGYNVLLAGDLGRGAPSQIVLTPRRAGGANQPQAGANPQQQQMQQQQDQDDEGVEQPEQPEPPQPEVPQPPPNQPNYGPSGPMRTPQEIMQEMQQRQLLQQQQMQQQMQQQQQQGNPTAPQQQENPE